MFGNLFTLVKNNKFFVIALIFIISTGCGLLLFIDKNLDSIYFIPSEIRINDALREAGSVVSFEGTVEVLSRGIGNWWPVAANQILYAGDSVRTVNASNAVLLVDLEVITLGAESEVEIKIVSKSKIVIDQKYGKSYSAVEKKEGQIYQIRKDDVEITALGTEFLVDVSKNENVISTYVFKNKVLCKLSKGEFEIAELNKSLLNTSTLENVNSPLSNDEKELNKPYLALMKKSEQIIAQKKQAIKNKSGSATTSSATSTSSSTASGSSGSASTGNSGGSTGESTNIQGRYSNTSVESIVNSLALIKDDATGDFTEPGGGGPPGGVYQYSPIDLDNLYIGVRDGRLYIKWALAGTIPSTRQTIDDNIIKSVTYNIKLSNEADPNSSNNCGGTTAFIQINIQYHDNGQIWYNPWFNAICNNSGPYQTDDDWRFATTGNGLAHTYNSGLGKNSIVYSYAMSDMGNFFNAGDTLKIDIYSEAESNNWGHYSFEGNPPPWSSVVIPGV
ncbi:MAG: hypothetical protein Athens101428_713 [Candidatus Berkelbacteria bacterium Athens1014_28]|uniref:FecR protein domain-containing protein n=1 Tax=Candidatus Berkelbacteria bacterium Athens1014_28 TaxID=2017145 RepID=A0A554LK85_9BACT|nr:MAG: hypothetical protein Athens101428_713 [Candidatus Berkelbacteria bacterium Athens1014_28]